MRRLPYYVNRDGEKVVEGKDGWVKEGAEERKPFLDEEDNPIDVVAEKEEKPKTAKRRTRKTKTDQESV